jgi:ubiquinol-cytochrome c reductase iron-sulfur subunit
MFCLAFRGVEAYRRAGPAASTVEERMTSSVPMDADGRRIGSGGGGHDAGSGTRRDFLELVTVSSVVIGAAALVWPLIDQMQPSADVIAQGAPLEVDCSKIEDGQQIVVSWRSKPMFILKRTKPMLELLQSQSLLGRLRDPDSTARQQPTYADNWHRSLKPEYAVLVGICTHLGCIPELKPEKGTITADWPGGYFCPCHGSKYDFAGRVFSGVPAPYNLPVPPYRFVDDKTVRIGENPTGSTWDLGSVEQL